MMLVDMTPVMGTAYPGNAGVQFSNDDLNDFINRHLDAMDSLHGKHGFPKEENERIAALVMNYFQSLIS